MKKPRGIAIIATLLVAAIMMMLAASFLKINQNSFSITLQGEKSDAALEAAQSGLAYCLMRLETNRGWGHHSATNITSKDGLMQVFETENLDTLGGAKTFVSVGVLNGGDSHFQVVFPHEPVPDNIANGCFSNDDISRNPKGGPSLWKLDNLKRQDISCNNFMVEDEDRDLGLIPPPVGRGTSFSPGRAVPAYRATLNIIGYSRGVRRTIEVTLRHSLFTKSAMGAAGQMAIDCNLAWYLDNVGADRPVVETQSELFLPNPPNANPNETLARVLVVPGKVTAQGDIHTGGKFQATLDDLTGRIQFYWNSLSSSPSDFNHLGRDMNASMNPRTVVPAQKKPDIELMDRLLSRNREKTVTLDPGTYRFVDPNTVELLDSNGSVVKTLSGQINGLNIKGWRIEVPDGTRVNVAGELSITRASKALPLPVVALGYNDGMLPRATKAKGASLNVQNGPLSIDGNLVGNGSVVVNATSDADIPKAKISLTANSNVNGTESAGVAIYADGNIEIAGPQPADALSNSADWHVVGRALDRFATAEGRWSAFENDWFSRTTGTNKRLEMLEGHAYPIIGSTGGTGGTGNTGGTGASGSGTGANGATGSGEVTMGHTPALADYSVPTTDMKRSINDIIDQYKVANWKPEERDQLISNLRGIFGGDFDLHIQDTQIDIIMGNSASLTVTDYLRVREHFKKMQNAIDEQKSLPNQVADMTPYLASVYLMRDVSWFSRQARENEHTPWTLGTPLKGFLRAGENPLDKTALLNSTMEGLVYSASSVKINPGGGNFRMIGSILAGKDLAVVDANQITTVYDPQYIAKFSGFRSGRVSGSRLEQDFFRIR